MSLVPCAIHNGREGDGEGNFPRANKMWTVSLQSDRSNVVLHGFSHSNIFIRGHPKILVSDATRNHMVLCCV